MFYFILFNFILFYPFLFFYFGRFVPPSIALKYNLSLPDYGYGSNQIVVSSQSNEKILSPSVATVEEGVKEVVKEVEKEGVNMRRIKGKKEIMGMDEYCVIYVTAPSTEQANSLSRLLLEEKIVACVNLIPQVTSIYEWEGKIEENQEVMMMLKVRLILSCILADKLRVHFSSPLVGVVVLFSSNGCDCGCDCDCDCECCFFELNFIVLLLTFLL